MDKLAAYEEANQDGQDQEPKAKAKTRPRAKSKAKRNEPDRDLWPNDYLEWAVTVGLFCVFEPFSGPFIIEAVALTVSIMGIIGGIIALVHIAQQAA